MIFKQKKLLKKRRKKVDDNDVSKISFFYKNLKINHF